MNYIFNRRGFTLVELLITLVVLGILFVLGLFLFGNVQDSSHNTAAKADVRGALMKATSGYVQNQRSFGSTTAEAINRLEALDTDGLSYTASDGPLVARQVFVQLDDAGTGYAGPVGQQITLCVHSQARTTRVYCLRANQEQAFPVSNISEEVPLLINTTTNIAYANGPNTPETVCALPQPGSSLPSPWPPSSCDGLPGWGGDTTTPVSIDFYYYSDEEGGWDIWGMSADGSLRERITNDGNVGSPKLSPDGTKIVYKDWSSFPGDVWSMNSDGTNATLLGEVSGPANWSPDSTLVVWADHGSVGDIHFRAADGSNPSIQVTSSSGSNRTPNFSPDGSRIVFISNRDGGQLDIYVADAVAGGGTQDRITNTSSAVLLPTFSPDGDWIYFLQTPNWRLHRVPSSGGVPTQLHSSSTDGASSYSISPDGSRLALVDTSGQVWLMDADGSNQVLAVDSPLGGGYYPTWSPDGSTVIWNCYTPAGDGICSLDTNGPFPQPVINMLPDGIWAYEPNWAGYEPSS